MIGLALVLCALVLVIFLAVKPYSYWRKRNVKTSTFVPVFGDYYRVILGKESVGQAIVRSYNEVQNVRYYGSYQFQLPALILKSPELIKQVCVKQFGNFSDHRSVLVEGVDDLWTKNLVSLKGEHWKRMRSILSPSFTSSKMKAMFLQITQHAKSFTQHFLNMNGQTIEVEFKDAFTRYATDVIASTAFGIQIDSLENKHNEFYVMGRRSSVLGNAWGLFVFLAYQVCPVLASFFRLRLFEDEIQSFFLNLVKKTMELREEQNIKRPDMLGLLMEARKEEHLEEKTEQQLSEGNKHLAMETAKPKLSDSDIASQVSIFFLGGYETVSTALCFMLYELAIHPAIQNKLCQEIDRKAAENDEVSFETVSGMTYLDMVVSESLRKWPVGIFTDRVVNKAYTIHPESPVEEPLTLKIGDYVIIPLLAFHYDPKYFTDPEKFIPERFSPENRKNIDPYTYFPFGVGPRSCIGSRLALLEMKTLLFYILKSFEIVPVEKTNIPVKISKTSFNLKSTNGFPLGLKKRNKHKF